MFLPADRVLVPQTFGGERGEKSIPSAQRIGDSVLAAIILLYTIRELSILRHYKTWDISGAFGQGVFYLGSIGIFAGAVGKSAQFPLHVLAAERDGSPAPVSALIHAATMAAAGVFLVARTYPLFENSATA